MPDEDEIFSFINSFHDCLAFDPVCCVIALIYINRMIAFTGIALQPTSFRPLILCGLLVACKVWDDRRGLANADFCFIYPFFDKLKINELEKKFLLLLEYHVTVKASLFCKYYLELRTLMKKKSAEFPVKAISDEEARKLEVNTIGFKRGLLVNNSERKTATFNCLPVKSVWD